MRNSSPPRARRADVGRLARALDGVSPAAGALVMATGVVSLDLLYDGARAPSLALLAVAAVAWLVLAGAVLLRAARTPGRLRREARTPGALTGPAGTCVLAVRLAVAGRWGAALGLAALGLLAWAGVLPRVLRRLPPRTRGVHFLVVVATEAAAGVLALLAAHAEAGWLVEVALGLALAGLALYGPVALRFDLAELRRGAGDQWVLGGALAICVVTLVEVTEAARAAGTLAGARSALDTLATAVAAAGLAAGLGLAAAELRWPRLRYDARRWATVFPLGMYGLVGYDLAGERHVQLLAAIARGWSWVATAVWLVVAAGLLRRLAPPRRRR
jgi:hypothetical protein